MTRQRTTLRNRICVAALGTSLGIFATTATAQQPPGSNTGRAIGDAIGNQLQRGTTDPVQRGIGAAARGAIQGQRAGDAVQQGFGEAARSAVETPQQTMQRDRFETGQIYQDGRFDQQGRVYQDGRFYDDGRIYQGQVYQDGRVYQDDRVYQGGRVYQDPRVPQGRVYQEQRFRAGDGSFYENQTQGFDGRVEAGAQQRARLGITMNANERGVIVKNVARGTAAANAGLRPGDVILDVNGQQISSPQQMSRLIRQRSPGDQVVLNVLRDGQRQRVNATLAAAQTDGGAYRSNRPAMQGQTNDPVQLRQQVEMLQQEVQDLRSQLQQTEAGAAGSAQLDADQRTQLDADQRTQLDADQRTQLDADQRSRTEADLRTDQGIDAQRRQPAETDATRDEGLDLDVDANQRSRTEAEADRSDTLRGDIDADARQRTQAEGTLGGDDADLELDDDAAADLELDVNTNQGAQGGAAAPGGEL